ncbi:MAG: hypothetical protein HUU50_08825 [Candidatus Brocadiae bacterium]|nr:hypothetical protein [Candidatus Brocadiia bacterium]
MHYKPIDKMAIPKPGQEVFISWMLMIIIVGLIALSLNNLYNQVAVLPSFLWLIMIVSILVFGSVEQGAWAFLTNILGAFAFEHFLEIAETDVNLRKLCFGFRIIGIRVIQKSLDLKNVKMLQWSPGQATSIAGKDMNDWSVVIWFGHDNHTYENSQKAQLNPDQDLYILGPARAKEITEVLGHEILAFIHRAGINMVQGKDEFTFVNQGNI